MAACHSQTRLIFSAMFFRKVSPLRHAPVPIFGGEPRHILWPYLGKSRPKSIHGGESSCWRRWAVGGASAEPNSIKRRWGIPVKRIDGDQNQKEAKTSSYRNKKKGIPKHNREGLPYYSHDIPCEFFFASYSNRHYAENGGLQRSGSALRSNVFSGGTIFPSESTWCWWVHKIYIIFTQPDLMRCNDAQYCRIRCDAHYITLFVDWHRWLSH